MIVHCCKEILHHKVELKEGHAGTKAPNPDMRLAKILSKSTALQCEVRFASSVS